MNMKKIISSVCALSIAATSFVTMAISANAEGETVLWSDTFNGYENVKDHFNQSATLGKVLADGTTGQDIYQGIEGIELQTVNRGNGDDSSWFKLNDKESAADKCLTTMVSRFATVNRGNNIDFLTDYAAESGKDVVLAFDVMYSNAGGTTYDNSFLIGTTVFNVETAGIEQNVWTKVKAVVTTSGTSIYVGDSTTAVATGADTSVTNIKFDAYSGGASIPSGDQKSGTHPTGYLTFSLDNIVVYNSADGANSTVPEAETKGEIEVEYFNAPETTVPDGMNVIAKHDFNDSVPTRLIFMSTEESTYTDFDGITLSIGNDADTHSETKWSTVGNAYGDPEKGTDLYLQAANSVKSTANRGPKLAFNREVEERENVGVQFAARLHAGETAPAEMIFSGDLVASASKGNLASPLAMITTDDEAASGVYACDNPLTMVADGGTSVLEVADNEWFIVTISATRAASKTATASIAVTTKPGTEEETTTYIFGSETEMKGIQNSSKSGVNNLPYISFRSGNDTDYGVSNSSNDIDNIVYYTDGDTSLPAVPDTEITDVEIAADGLSVNSATESSDTAVIIKATPKGDGTFTVEIIKGLDVGDKTLEWAAAPVAGDKIMVFNGFNSLMPAALIPVVIQ